MMLQVFALGIEPIVKAGTEELKRNICRGWPPGASGHDCGHRGHRGSDATGMRSSYKKDGDDFILNGRKCFITNSHIADTITVLAKDEENPKAFCAFVLDERHAGMEGHP